jgi:hypothetical protein
MTDTRIAAYQPPIIKRRDLLPTDPPKPQDQAADVVTSAKIEPVNDDPTSEAQPLIALTGRSEARIGVYNARLRQPEEPAIRGRFLDVIA